MRMLLYLNSIRKFYIYKAILSNLLILFSCLLAGCSLQPVDIVSVKGENLKGRSDIPLIDPNDPNSPLLLENKSDQGGLINITWKNKGCINLRDKCRIKYHWLYHLINDRMVVEGRLGRNDNSLGLSPHCVVTRSPSQTRKYPIVLDTGCSVTCIVNDLHVIENKMPIYHLGNNPVYSADMGLCKLPKLRIGKMTMVDLPCLYIEKREAIQVFGVTIGFDESIFIGLQVLRKFKYVMFDNVNKEVEFSPKEIFEPVEANLWISYPFLIKEKSSSNDAIFVTMPLAGQEVELYLDTGSGQGLQFSEQMWEKLREKISITELRSGNFRTAFLEHYACKKGIVKELDMGGRTIKNVEIVVLPNDNPSNLQTLLGMKCFRDTVMVLDFERNLLWVKNKQK